MRAQQALSRCRRGAAAALLAAVLLTWASGVQAGAARPQAARQVEPVPGIDADFVYRQLAFMATHFQHREAGYRAGASGHAGFARYWTAEMLRLLRGFGTTARRYPFRTPGWLGRPATARAVNVEITVPGVVSPAQVVVIGCHYDGEAGSTQSAYDDASGCAVELGVAKAMAGFWRGHGVYPVRTLRFVIFDAEEQGLVGSFSYVNDAANGSVPQIVAMINEEQSGIGYPLRYLGKLANPLMSTDLLVAPTVPNTTYPALALSPAQAARNSAFAKLVSTAAAGSFGAFRRLGDQELTYHGTGGRAVWAPIFTPGQLGKLPVASDTLGSSDQMPFTTAGIPDATFVGSSGYYSQAPPIGSYPFDQPQDTITLMNTFADGGATRSHALSLALAVPGMLTTWMLSQPGIGGQAPPDGRPIAAIGSIQRTRPGRPVLLRAAGFDPASPHVRLRYTWAFGDGTTATGAAVRHAYARAGRYPLRLTITGRGLAPRVIRQPLAVGQQATYRNPYLAGRRHPRSAIARAAEAGKPPANPLVTLPAATSGLTDKVRLAPAARPAPARSQPVAWILTGVVAAALAIAAIILAARRRAARGRRLS